LRTEGKLFERHGFAAPFFGFLPEAAIARSPSPFSTGEPGSRRPFPEANIDAPVALHPNLEIWDRLIARWHITEA
jgi:hypothetical protein